VRGQPGDLDRIFSLDQIREKLPPVGIGAKGQKLQDQAIARGEVRAWPGCEKKRASPSPKNAGRASWERMSGGATMDLDHAGLLARIVSWPFTACPG